MSLQLRKIIVLSLALAIATSGCSHGEPSPAEELDALLSQDDVNYGRVRQFLLSTENGAALLTNLLASADYETAQAGMQVLAYGFAAERTDQGMQTSSPNRLARPLNGWIDHLVPKPKTPLQNSPRRSLMDRLNSHCPIIAGNMCIWISGRRPVRPA